MRIVPPSGSFDQARGLLRQAIDRRVAPAIAAEVGRVGDVVWREALGTLTYDADASPVSLRTIFDLASLTKVIATTTIAMRQVDAGLLDLRTPVRDLVPGWRGSDRAAVTIQDLLEHAAGLPPVLPFYERCRGREDFERAICETTLEYAPRTRSVYSDLGFILLGFILTDTAGVELTVQLREVARSLWLGDDDFLDYGPVHLPLGERTARLAPTQADAWRGGRLLRGEVDDRNGAALDGVAGHTGLFGTLPAVGRFAREILRARLGGSDSRLALPATVQRFVRRSSVPGSSRALGWDTMLTTSSCGTRMSADAFGHTGFTGGSIWIDPAADVYAVLLTNRVHPQAGSPDPIRELRRAFHDEVMGAIAGRAYGRDPRAP